MLVLPSLCNRHKIVLGSKIGQPSRPFLEGMEDVLSNNSYFCRFKPCWLWSVSTLWLCRSWSFAHWRGFCRSPNSTALLPAVSRSVQTPAAAPAGAVIRSVGVWCQGLDLYFLSVKLWQSWLSQFPNFSPFSDSVWLIAAAAATESDILISKVLLKSQPIICHKARPRPECFPTFQLPFFRPLRELCPAWDCCPERSSLRWAVNTAPSIVTILADTEPFPSEFSLARWYCTG